MKHRVGFNELSRSQAERKALLSYQGTSLILEERISTTKAKALETRKIVEKLITKAKRANFAIKALSDEGKPESLASAKAINVHAHRQVARYLDSEEAVAKVFNTLAPLFASRNGGYTRILKTGFRQGDAAQMVILEFVEKSEEADKKSTKWSKSNKAKKEPKEKKETSSKSKDMSKVKELKAQGATATTHRKFGV